MTTPTTILSGTVGSTAYGLAREGSDVDRLGVFVVPTLHIAGLNWSSHQETHHGTSETFDYTEHEIGKVCRLMLSCNPTVLELLWLPSYDVTTWEGNALLGCSGAFLSERAVRASYLGYAKSQARKLRDTGDFGSDVRKRTAKHGRHMLRLLRQGRELLGTGSMTLRVADPEAFWAFDDMSVEQMLVVFDREVELFDEVVSVLPAVPDRDVVTDMLELVRRAHVDAANDAR